MLGVGIGLGIIALWIISTSACLLFPFNFACWYHYLLIFLQTHLYTGLFITAHDAMHGIVAPASPQLNRWIGKIAACLFAFNSYEKMLPKHHAHHKFVGTTQDPDFHESQHFGKWYISFLLEYVSWKQVFLMAITYNILTYFFSEWNVFLFWMLPSLLSTLQLFYFGTYLPHRGEHEPNNIHKARSQKLHHFWAFVSCYFFGYHYEHHAFPHVPWWQLYRIKEMNGKN
ncbi:MAG: fatty acid desaturase [Cytophagales bacterium]|nr:fatty acid desaturase [Cytophagales bacterium]MDW8385328.1 fatty acid desaturase [Flammeovirgaceae bacterium]